ncbi:MAG: hypothetical protein ACYCX2_09300 [Christensenellales bacterium]
MRTICKAGLLILSITLFCGCAQKERAAFDLGTFDNQRYENDYLGLEFNAGEFSVLEAPLDDRLLPLAGISKEKQPLILAALSMGENTDILSYPVLQILAQHINDVPYISSAKEYVDEASAAFNEANTEYYEIEKGDIKLNGRTFYAVCAQLFTTDGQMIYLDLYVTVEGDYFVALAALSLDPQQSGELNSVIQSISFKK